MKHVKKLVSILLVLVMVLGLTTTTLAAQEGELTGGSITIDNAVSGQTYNAYQILYLESYNPTANAYSYKANSAWKTFVESTAIKNVYLKTDDNGYVTWVQNADPAAFAKLAQAEAAKMTADATVTVPENTTSITFSNLKLGYYLVDTSLGTLCALDTTNPSVTMKEKNEVPSIDKEVKEDSTGKYGESNTAQIGDTVEFKTTVHAKKGAQNYVLHDKMSEGLTLNQDSIEVKVGDTTLTKGTDYTVAFNVEHKNGEAVEYVCDFEIKFAQAYLDTITGNTDIVVTYTAVLNDKAVISTGSNTNDTLLDYGDNSHTPWDQTTTLSFMFDIVKTDANKKLLSGAKFELYDANTNGNKIALVKEAEGIYRVATDSEKNATGFTSAVIDAGKATVKGLDADTTYWLEEVQAPAGYNILPGRVEVKIEKSNLSTTMTGDTWVEGNGGVQITNRTGAELPDTGGMGTTILYIVGSALVLVAIVLLVTKKRMKNNN